MRDIFFLCTYLFFCFGLAFWLFFKHKFFRRAKGFLSVVFAGMLAVVIHNLLYALLFRGRGEGEPVFFIASLLLLGTGFFLAYFRLMRWVLWQSRLRKRFGIKERESWVVSVLAGMSLIIIIAVALSMNSCQKLKGMQREYWWVSAMEGEAEIAEEAGINCLWKGGGLEARRSPEGGYNIFCLFGDKSECETREFYAGKCDKGENFCQDLCGDGQCQEVVCQAAGCPCTETADSCPHDCL